MTRKTCAADRAAKTRLALSFGEICRRASHRVRQSARSFLLVVRCFRRRSTVPNFKVTGRSAQTKRKRTVVVDGRTEAEAQIKADRLGLTEVVLEQMPEVPATERQISYAKVLGIEIPAGATLEEMSNLISAKVDDDRPSDERHRVFARSFGIEVTEYIGKKALFDRIMSELSAPGRERELVSWFAFRVTRTIFKGRKDAPVDGPDHPIIQQVADEVSGDPSIVKSIRRYTGQSLIWFGEITGSDGRIYSGGSVGTTAYKRINALLGQNLSIDNSRPERAQPRTFPSQARKKSGPAKKGCLPVVLFAMSGVFVAVYAVLHAVGNA